MAVLFAVGLLWFARVLVAWLLWNVIASGTGWPELSLGQAMTIFAIAFVFDLIIGIFKALADRQNGSARTGLPW